MAFDCDECEDSGVLYPLEFEEAAWPDGVPCFHCERGEDVLAEAERSADPAETTQVFRVKKLTA